MNAMCFCLISFFKYGTNNAYVRFWIYNDALFVLRSSLFNLSKLQNTQLKMLPLSNLHLLNIGQYVLFEYV